MGQMCHLLPAGAGQLLTWNPPVSLGIVLVERASVFSSCSGKRAAVFKKEGS